MADEEVRQFETWDWVLFAAMLAVSAGIGIFYAVKDLCSEKKNPTGEFLMGGRNMQLLPVAVSILVSFMSAILILGTPAEMYTAGTLYFMYLLGMILAIILSTLLFVPLLYPLTLTSSFEYLELRFQSRLAKLTGTVIMIVQQILYMGIASYAPSTALEAVTGFPTWATIITVGCVSTFYTFLGGMKAVVWTDVFQSVIMIAGLLAIVIQGIIKTGGFSEVWNINDQWDRIDFWEADPDPTVRHSIWSLVVGGTIGWLGTYGVNQASVQRYCAVSTLPKSRGAVLLNVFGVIILVTLTSLAGIVMFAFYAQKGCDPLTSNTVSNSNQLIPYFVMEVLGYPGLPGLFISCLFSGALSTMSSCLNALSAVTWEDIFKPLIGDRVTETTKTWIIKLLVALYGAAGVGFAFMAQNLGGTVLQASLSFTGAASGPLLGIFLLGGVFPWANAAGCVVGGFLGLALPLWISIGAYNLPSSGYSLDFPTDNCTLENATTLVPSTTVTPAELSGVDLLYTVSYLWYPSIGMATAIIVGLIVSFATAPLFPQEEIDPKYLIPFFDRLFCCLPDRWRRPCRCGYEFQNPEDIMHERDQEIIVENGVIQGLNQPDDQKTTASKRKEKIPMRDRVSGLTYRQSETPQFVYDNALFHTENGQKPYNGYGTTVAHDDIPPKYDEMN
ncbi:sodium-coupled monocarboxylate transporter 1-like [Mercenaria mercenaria]|uniref:sodium-coupled monocarboxylate transporter 1-like n=1 Tax=Mercenaria mercenaria TaxID=6596 RepID=UPI00234EAC2B|nr:sodium-coupled monocarboxylate transporter 1-like [Mercenaria mercenaria]